MKKLFLVTITFISFCFAALAQKPIISVKGGFNFGKWKLEESTSANHSRMGIQLGASAEIPVQDAITIQPELSYCQFGSTFRYYDEVSRYKANYILLPVVAEYHFKHGISAHLGPQLGYLISAKSNLDGDKDDFRDGMDKFDIFIVFGAEYELKNGLSLGFRFHHGLTSAEKYASASLRNRGISLIASYPIKGSITETINGIFK